MTELVSVDEILTPEELASCRAYFIAASNNASNGFTEPPFFRIWLRMVLLTLRRDKSPKTTNHDVATQTLPPSTSILLSADTISPPTPTSSLGSLGPPQLVPPVTTLPPKPPSTEPARPSANPGSSFPSSTPVPPAPTEPSALKKTAVPKPPIPTTAATPVNVAPTSNSPSNVAQPLDKTVATTPSKISSTPAVKPPANAPQGYTTPNQSNAKNAAPAPPQIAKRSSPMPKSAATSTVANGSGSVAINATPQFTATGVNTQTNVQPSRAPLPTTPTSKTTSAITHSGARSNQIATPLAVPHPAGSPIVVQTLPARGNAPTAVSRTGQSCSTLPSTPALNANIPQHKVGLAIPLTVASHTTEVGRKPEANDPPKILVFKHIYEALLQFYTQHRAQLLNSAASIPSTSQPATVPPKETRIDPPVNIPNKRKQEDTNGKARQFDHSREEGEISGRSSRNDSNGRGRGSDYGGSREYQWRRNQSGEPRRKRYRRQYRDYRDYGDYYDGSDDYDDYGSDDY